MKNSMKKFIAFLTIIMLAAFVISSCNTNPSESSQNSGAASKSAISSQNSSTANTSTESAVVSDTSSDGNGNYSVENMLDALIEYGFIKDDEAKLTLNAGITRSQALKILLRLTKNEDYALKTNWGSGDTHKHTFTDIEVADEINLYASCALHIGYIKDSGDHKFCGNDNIKADEFVSWLLRALDFDDVFGHFDPKSPWELSNKIGLTSGQFDEFTFEDVIKCSFTALKTQRKNDSQSMYYYYFVYKRIDVDYPEIFYTKGSDYLIIDEFDSIETLAVNGEGTGSVAYPGGSTTLSFTVLDPTVATFKFEGNNKNGSSVLQNYSIKALKKGQTAIKITFEDENRSAVALINVIVN